MKKSSFFLLIASSIFFVIFVKQTVAVDDFHLTTEQYDQRFGRTALNVACKHAHYRIIVELIQRDGAPDLFTLKQIIQALKKKQCDDLRSIFIAYKKNTISDVELTQVIAILQEQPEKRDRYGKIVPKVRICNGNTTALNFALFDELSLELQKKICTILWLNEKNFIQKDFC